jgi:hypothetical protein
MAVLADTKELVAWDGEQGTRYWMPLEVQAGVTAAVCGPDRAIALLVNGSIVAWALQKEAARQVDKLAERGLGVAAGLDLLLATVQSGADAGRDLDLSKPTRIAVCTICLFYSTDVRLAVCRMFKHRLRQNLPSKMQS